MAGTLARDLQNSPWALVQAPSGAEDASPRREPWDAEVFKKAPERGERKRFRPFQGLRFGFGLPRAHALG